MGRPKEHGADTRARLLAEAGRLLANEGAQALSLRRLADRVGTTTRAVYSLFGNKEGLLSAMYEQMADTLTRRHLAIPIGSDPMAELVELAMAYRASALEHPNLYPLVFKAVPGFTPEPHALEHVRTGLRRVRAVMEQGIENSTFVGRDTRTMVHELWGLVHGLASLEIAGVFGSERRGRKIWRDAVSSLVDGFTRPPGRSASRHRRFRK